VVTSYSKVISYWIKKKIIIISDMPQYLISLREATELPFLEMFKIVLDKVLSNLT